jgi:diguanylate cyclase (GGDEF)-like protein
MIGAERGSLLLYPEEGRTEPEMTISRNISRGQTGNGHHEMSRAILERIQREKTPLIVDDALTEINLQERNSIVREGVRSVLCAPITVRGTMIGLIYLDNRMVSGVFTTEDLEVLDLLGSQAGVSIENARLYKRAVRDGLTGLYNRAFFDNFLIKSVSLSRRYNTKLSMLLLDVDHFKKVNDTHGHQAGDEVLKSLAATIEDQIRESDVACRYGGEEFVVVLTETDLEGAVTVAEKLRRVVETLSIPYGADGTGGTLSVTISVGVGQYHDGQERVTFIDSVDHALYEAKENGRNRVSTVR